MGLKIYQSPVPEGFITSSNDDLYIPATFTFKGSVGGILHRRFWVRNDNVDIHYSNILLSLKDSASIGSIVTSSLNRTGFAIKLSAGDDIPSEATWRGLGAGGQITLPDLGTSKTYNITSYLPFWIRVEVPVNQATTTIKTVTFVLTATANWIG